MSPTHLKYEVTIEDPKVPATAIAIALFLTMGDSGSFTAATAHKPIARAESWAALFSE
jgi:hypothetical protein